jgi:hypothetical protein
LAIIHRPTSTPGTPDTAPKSISTRKASYPPGLLGLVIDLLFLRLVKSLTIKEVKA